MCRNLCCLFGSPRRVTAITHNLSLLSQITNHLRFVLAEYERNATAAPFSEWLRNGDDLRRILFNRPFQRAQIHYPPDVYSFIEIRISDKFTRSELTELYFESFRTNIKYLTISKFTYLLEFLIKSFSAKRIHSVPIKTSPIISTATLLRWH